MKLRLNKCYQLGKAYKRGMLIIAFMFFGNFYLKTFSQSNTPPDAKARVSGTINCINSSVTLIGESNTPNTRFSWTGPGGYKSTSRNSVTTLPGEYTLKVVGPGGITTSVVDVIVDTIPPQGVKASVSGLLTCADTTVILIGGSSTSGVTYNWKGQSGFVSSKEKTLVKVPGMYLLVVTNPANGCTANTNIEVQQNITPPAGVTAIASGVLSCKKNLVTLTGSSLTKGVTYNWLGYNVTSSLQTFDISTPGDYKLKVTDPENGCSTVKNLTVRKNDIVPAEVKATVSGIITCKTQKVNLTASSSTKESTFKWSGPEDFMSLAQGSSTNTPGNYSLEVTHPESGCTVSKIVTVKKDITEPQGVTATASGELTCNIRSVNLVANSTTPNVVYTWSGPDNFTSGFAKTPVNKAGTYSVNAIKSDNGCSITMSVNVSENKVAPEKIKVEVSGQISCATPSVKLTGKSVSTGLNYKWKGPNGFLFSGITPSVGEPGEYILTTTNPLNGCSSNVTVTVVGEKCKDKLKPQ